LTRYNTIGIGYNKYRNADNRIVSTLIDLLNLPEKSIVCDIGAGTGNYSNALADSGYRIKAIEPSIVMWEQAKPNKAVEWFSGTADSIPLKDRSADGLISTFAVQHFPDISAAASEMWRVCGDNSIIILTVDPRKGEHFWLHDYFPVVHKITIYTINKKYHKEDKVKLC
jgi:ubiquinone/menaquinone biosynthesis C-methylase UbiE